MFVHTNQVKTSTRTSEHTAILNVKSLCNNTISFPACVYEVPACFPPYLYDMIVFVYRLSHDL